MLHNGGIQGIYTRRKERAVRLVGLSFWGIPFHQVEGAEPGKTQSKQSCKTSGTIPFAEKEAGQHVTGSMIENYSPPFLEIGLMKLR